MILVKEDINKRLEQDGDEGLWIDPLLDKENQIGDLTIDLRLGCDFLVSIVTRRPYIGIVRSDDHYRPMSSYFQPTRRKFGERFILFPNQTVLATTLEYISLPCDCYASLFTRSSYSRLGISISGTIAEPSFRGCFSVELFNNGNSPIELIVGSRIYQMNLTKLSKSFKYTDTKRKYLGNIWPIPSRATEDYDLGMLVKASTNS